MNLVVVLILGVGALFLVGIVLLGAWYPGSGADQLDWRTPREHAETEAARDADDLAQMLEAANARRRARGERELTVEELIDEVE